MIAITDPSGVPIAIYPKENVAETEFSIFTGVVKSLDNLVKGIEGESVNYIELGTKIYRIDRIGEYLVITKLNEKPSGDVEWFFELLLNSLNLTLKYVKEEDGLVESHESNLFSNILRKFYEKYNELVDLYGQFKEEYSQFVEKKKNGSLDIVRNLLEPELELETDEDNVKLKRVRTGDIERFIEILKTALNYMRSEV